MADPIDQYLTEVAQRAKLPRRRARTVRAELKDHLAALVEESNLTYHIFAIRKALGEAPDGEKYIETVPRKGYRLVASLTAEPPSTLNSPILTGVPVAFLSGPRIDELFEELAPPDPLCVAVDFLLSLHAAPTKASDAIRAVRTSNRRRRGV